MYFSLISRFFHNIVTIIEYNINNNKNKHHNSDISDQFSLVKAETLSSDCRRKSRQKRKKAPEKITEL